MRYIFCLFISVLFGCATGGLRSPASESDELPSRVIDAHLHTDFNDEPEESSGIMQSLEQLTKEMSENNVVAAIAHLQTGGRGYKDLSEQKIFHCYGVPDSPNWGALEEGLRTKRYRCFKIYLGYVHKYASDPSYHRIYRLAEQYDVPVVFHTGDPYDVDGKLKYADPLTIDEVAVDFRKVNFVIAHLGNPWIQSAAEVVYKNPNVYVEASALLIGNLDKEDPAKVEEYLVKPLRWAFGYIEDPKKLMFGTDWPLVGQKQYIRAYMKAIPKEHWDDVFYNNAARVFRISR